MKSREEVEKLKEGWYRDPCWDIEDTEGFEKYRKELLRYRHENEAEWQKAHERRHVKLASRVCPMSMAYVHRNPDDTGFSYDTCQVERCAWWNEVEECCAVRALNLRG